MDFCARFRGLCLIFGVCLLLAACDPSTPPQNVYYRTADLETFPPKQYSNAYNYFYGRAIKGDAAAQNNLGHMYMDGRGVEQDPAKAVYWYHQAAVRGYRAAEVNLGVAYLYGRGTKKDKPQACYWFAQARAKGSPEASDFYVKKCQKKQSRRRKKTK